MKKFTLLLTSMFCFAISEIAGADFHITNITHDYNSQTKQLTLNWELNSDLPSGYTYVVDFSDDEFNNFTKDSLTSPTVTFEGIEITHYEGFIYLMEQGTLHTSEYFEFDLKVSTSVNPIYSNGILFQNNVIRNTNHSKISLYNLSGALVLSSHQDIDMTKMPCGLYMVKAGKEVIKLIR